MRFLFLLRMFCLALFAADGMFATKIILQNP